MGWKRSIGQHCCSGNFAVSVQCQREPHFLVGGHTSKWDYRAECTATCARVLKEESPKMICLMSQKSRCVCGFSNGDAYLKVFSSGSAVGLRQMRAIEDESDT